MAGYITQDGPIALGLYINRWPIGTEWLRGWGQATASCKKRSSGVDILSINCTVFTHAIINGERAELYTTIPSRIVNVNWTTYIDIGLLLVI